MSATVQHILYHIVLKNLYQLNIKDDFNIKLLKYIILSEAEGINEISKLFPSKGETIHVYEYNIKNFSLSQLNKTYVFYYQF